MSKGIQFEKLIEYSDFTAYKLHVPLGTILNILF